VSSISYYTCKIDSILFIPKLTSVASLLLRQTYISLSKDVEWSRLTQEAGDDTDVNTLKNLIK